MTFFVFNGRGIGLSLFTAILTLASPFLLFFPPCHSIRRRSLRRLAPSSGERRDSPSVGDGGISVQCAGVQSPTSKGILEEPTLLQVDCPRQREGDKLSLSVLDSKRILVEADQAREAPKNYAEDEALGECNYALSGLMDELPNVMHSAERPLVNGECSRSRNKHEQDDSFLETDASLMADCNMSDCASDAKASFAKEKLCKEEAGKRSSPYLQCNGNGSCLEQKKGVALIETICRSSDYDVPIKDSRINVINEEDKEEDALCGATSTIIETHNSRGECKEKFGTPQLPALTFQEQYNLSVEERNNEILSASVDSVQSAEKIESQVQDLNQEGESGSLGSDYVEEHTVALWVKKLAVAMLNISVQLHTEAVIEVARKATKWKEFAMEAACCRDYSDLGRMLVKLQTMILPTYVSDAWLENSFGLWKRRCQNAHSAESVEILTKELMASVRWSKVDDLWNALVQPELGPEWTTWKQEAMKWFSTLHPIANGANIRQRNFDTSLNMEPQISGDRLKLKVHQADSCASELEASDCRTLSQVDRIDTDSGHSVCQGITGSTPGRDPLKVHTLSEVAPMDLGTVNDRWDEIPNSGGGIKLIEDSAQMSTDGRHGNVAIVAPPYQYRQCSAFIAAKGRQCGRWASDGDVYCCVHTNASSGGKSLQDQRPPPDAPMCQGMTTHGHKCKHRARLGSAFCKKHRLQRSHDSAEMNNLSVNDVSMSILSTSSGGKLKRKFGENNALEKFSSSNASNSEELGLITVYENSVQENLIPVTVDETLDERNCLMKESELYNALPTPVRAASPDFPCCIGCYGQANSGPCLENAKRHTLYCENHIPKFLKRARNGKSRLVSKDVFINLLKNCSSRKQKLYLHQACELLYGFMKRNLSREKPIFKGNIMEWTLSEASKDLNVGEYLLKLVSCEREKIMRIWGFGTDKEAIFSGTNVLSTLEIHEKDRNTEMTMKCKICAVEFSDDQMLGAHWTESHKKEARWLFRGYACAVCMNSFTNRKVLESHVKERHGPQFLEHSILFRCMSCNSHFVNPEQLWQHVLSSHLTEFRMADHGQRNIHSMDQLDQPRIESFKRDDFPRFICRFCGLKFDLLPDLGRHHQVAHKNQSSINHFRGNHYIKHNRHGYPRFKKSFGAAYRFKNQTSFGVQKRFPSPNLVLSLRPKLRSQVAETLVLGRLLESHCADVAERLFSEIQKTKPRPSNPEILSFARSACCRISLHAALEAKYGVLPENFYLKAAKLCSEQNIQIGWHVEGFICPKGCKPLMTTQRLTSMIAIQNGILDPPAPQADFANYTKWEMEECHYILDSKHLKAMQRSIVLCEDVSFGQEPVPVACVVDENLKDMLNISFHEISHSQGPLAFMPWHGFTYVTKRLIEPSVGPGAENTQLGCACPPVKCCPEKCDHVYLFDNDYENAEDIHGKSMRGRFPYDEKGRILLEQGHLVYECNSLCKCDATCHNRVLQKGIQVKLEIFKTEKKGWAVRAGEAISRGTFICEYIGEVMTDVEGNKRGQRYNKAACSYLYDINAHVGSRGLSEGTVPYVIDATKFGNVSRFINHSCSPNLVNYLVLVESMDFQLAHIGLYARRDIARGEELAYDYCCEMLPEGGHPCHCRAPNCRGRLY